MTSELRLACITYNVCNKNVPKRVIEEIASQLPQSDILIFSLQEAKSSFIKGENIAKRALKRLSKDNPDDAYQILHCSGFEVITKRDAAIPRLPRTVLVIAVKKNLIRQHINISIHDFFQYKQMNKGGVSVVLAVGSVKIGVVSLHQDSHKGEIRRGHANQFLSHLNAEGVDAIVVGGDLNERLVPNGHDEGEFKEDLGRFVRNEIQFDYLVERYCKLATKSSEAFPQFDFSPKLNQPTYFKEKNGGIKFKSRRNEYDIGAFDTFGIHNMNGTVLSSDRSKEPRVLHPGGSSPVSDHALVIKNYLVSLPELDFVNDSAKGVCSLRSQIEESILKGFSLFGLRSRHYIFLDGSHYMVPRRIKLIYDKVCGPDSPEEILDFVREIKSECQRYSTLTTFSSTNELIRNLVIN